MSASEFFPPADAFGRTAALAFESAFPVLGVPLRVRSNARAVLDLAVASFGGWRALPDALIRRSLLAQLDVVVQVRTEVPLPSRLEYRRHGPLFIAAGGEVLAAVRLPEQHAVVFVPAQALEAGEWFAAHVSGHGLLAASQRSRVPLHAAAVCRAGRTLLLMGASGAGKSTMTYACLGAGFDVLAEDTVFVDLSSAPRLWGYTPQLWMTPDSARFFPELASLPVVERANGKRRIRAASGPAAMRPVLTTTGDVWVVLLGRGLGDPSLEPIDSARIADLIERDDTEGFDQYPDTRPALVEWIRTVPAFQLDTGANPHAAARLLARVASDPHRPAGPAPATISDTSRSP